MNKIAVVGLGYVGLPVAVSFGMKSEVIGFDINKNRIRELKQSYDYTNEVDSKRLAKSNIHFTSEIEDLRSADFIIVAVPTPINKNNQPDLTPLLSASKTVGATLNQGDIVVYESTVYPGATMEDCVPVLEKTSGFINGEDFFVGYSPERINPGDKVHKLETITKVVSGQTPEVLSKVAEVYSRIIEAGVFKASSIEVAEAAKVIENTQRDVNIALMNELALIFDKLNISTREVLEAAGTKWNFLNFKPGLVGGHCIGVDPYYLTYKAQEVGYHPEVILSGRRINDGLSKFISSSIIKEMIKNDLNVKESVINIYGLTFKENCPDLRNTKVIEMIKELEEYGLTVNVNDIMADEKEAMKLYDVNLIPLHEMPKFDVAVFAVAHDEYKKNKKQILENSNDKSIIVDIQGLIGREELSQNQILWEL